MKENTQTNMQKLPASFEAWFDMLDTMTDGVYVADETFTTFYFVNRAYQNIFGMPSSSSHLQPDLWLSLINQQDVAQVETSLASFLKAPVAHKFDEQYQITTLAGQQIFVHHVSYAYQEQHSPKLLIGIISEINTAHANDEPLSHELMFPMDELLNAIDALNSKKLSVATQQSLNKIIFASEMIKDRIESLIAETKIKHKKIDLLMLPFDFRLAIEEIALAMVPVLQQKDIDIIVDFQEDIPRLVVGDSHYLKHGLKKLLNIIISDVQYATVVISVAAISTKKQITEYQLSVKTIFNSYTYITNSTNTDYAINTCRQYLSLLGGDLNIIEKDSHYIEYMWRLNLSLQATRLDEYRSRCCSFNAVKILIADDNELESENISRMLTYWGASVTITTPKQVLEKLTSQDHTQQVYQILLIQHEYADFDCLQMLDDIATEKHTQNLMIVSMSQSVQLPTAQDLLSHQVTAHLVKPLQPSEFAHTLFQAWRGWLTVKKQSLHSGLKTTGPILLVEHNVLQSKITKIMLNSLGYEVYTAVSAEEGLSLLLDSSFSMILLDTALPDIDSLDLLGVVRRRQKGGEHCSIIMMLTYDCEYDSHTYLEEGADDFIVKPVVLQELEGLLEKWQSNKLLANDAGKQQMILPES